MKRQLSLVSADPGAATSLWDTGEAAALPQLAFLETTSEVLRVLPPIRPKLARSLTRTFFAGLTLSMHPSGDFKIDVWMWTHWYLCLFFPCPFLGKTWAKRVSSRCHFEGPNKAYESFSLVGGMSSEVRTKTLRGIKSIEDLSECLGVWKFLLADFATVLIMLVRNKESVTFRRAISWTSGVHSMVTLKKEEIKSTSLLPFLSVYWNEENKSLTPEQAAPSGWTFETWNGTLQPLPICFCPPSNVWQLCRGFPL